MMKRILLTTSMLILAAHGAMAQPVAAPVILPSALSDVGARASCPFIAFESGQSNATGADSHGDHSVPANTLITNSMTTATALVPAVYGTAPLNTGSLGMPNNNITTTTANPAQSMVSHLVSFANTLRAQGTIPASRQIVLAIAAVGGRPVVDWVNPVVAADGFNFQTYITQQWAVISAAYPGCSINAVIWDQGEADTSGTYGTQSAYGAAFTGATYQNAPFVGTLGIVPIFQALSGWSAQTRWVNVPMGEWADNIQQSRNDFFQQTRDGQLYPWMTEISTSGLIEGIDSPGPHYNGASQNVIGQKLFAAWNAGRINGYYSQPISYSGSANAFGNVIAAPSVAQTYTATQGATGTASQAGTTVTAILTSGVIGVGDTITLNSVTERVTVLSPGGAGTYTVNASQTVTSGTAMTSASYLQSITAIASGVPTVGYFEVGTGVNGGMILLGQLSGSAGGVGVYITGQNQFFPSTTVTAGLALGINDLRNGALINAYGQIYLPAAKDTPPSGFIISTLAAPSFVNVYSAAAVLPEESALPVGVGSPTTLNPGYLYQLTPVGLQWVVTSVYPKRNLRMFVPSNPVAASISQTYNSLSLNDVFYTLSGGDTMTLAGTYGNRASFYNLSAGASSTLTMASGTFILPDGTTPTTITILPGEYLSIVWGGTTGNAVGAWVTTDIAWANGYMPKLSAAPTTAPGAGKVRTFAVAGTTGGTCKIQALAGTSTTPVTIMDNVGGGC